MNTPAPIWLDASHSMQAGVMDRIQVAHGICAADSLHPCADMHGYAFEAGAMVAHLPWNSIDPEDLACRGVILGRHHAHDTVALVSIPGELLERLRGIRHQSRIPGRQTEAGERLISAVRAVSEHVRHDARWQLDPGAFEHAGFSTGPAPMRNTTLNMRTGCLVGLHLDSWDELPPLRRSEGQNRICINLGADDRWLQFIPLTAAAMFMALRAKGGGNPGNESSFAEPGADYDLARHFLEVFPGVPVIRVRMHPGEAYIAPTENLVHDGCIESGIDDLTLTIRGRIGPV